MAQGRVAIISENNNIYRLVAAELELMGFLYERVDFCDSNPHGYFAAIYDCTESSLIPHTNAKIKLAIIKRGAPYDLSGFSDTLIFPFSLQSFRAALQGNSDTSDEKTNEKCLILDKKSMSVALHGTHIKLTEYELLVLETICKNSGKCVTREDLCELLGGDGESNIADVYICHLRKKLEEPFGIKIIYSVRGKGYKTDYTLK